MIAQRSHTLVLLVALAAARPSLGSFLAPGAWDLRETLRYALLHSPVLKGEEQQKLVRELEYQNTGAVFFPSLDLSSTHGLQGNETPRPTDPWVSQFGLKLTENLYDNHESITRRRLADIRKKAAQLSLQRTRDQLCLEVATQFYALSLALKIAELKRQQRVTVDKHFSSIKSQYEQGLKPRKDYLRLKGQAQRTELEERDALAQSERTRAELLRLIGRSPEDTGLQFQSLEALEKLPPLPSEPPKAQSSYEYRLAKAQFAQSPLEVSLAERRNLPQLYLSLGANYQTSQYLGTTGGFAKNAQYGWNALLTLNYNLWDWGQRRRDIGIAQARASIEENNLRRTELEVEEALKKLSINLERLHANYRVAKSLLKAEEESYEFIRREYQEGKLPYLDLITSLNDLLDARSRYVSAYFELLSTVVRHHYYAGNLYDTLVSR